MQFLTETGVVGLLLFVVAGARPRRAPRAAERGRSSRSRSRCPRTSLHGLIDIDWDFAAVSAPVFLIAGAVAARVPERARRLSLPAVLVGAGVALAVAVLALRRVARRPLDASEAARRSTRPRARGRAREARALGRTRSRSSRSSPRRSREQELAATSARRSACSQEATRVQPENAGDVVPLGEFDLACATARARRCRSSTASPAQPAGPGATRSTTAR